MRTADASVSPLTRDGGRRAPRRRWSTALLAALLAVACSDEPQLVPPRPRPDTSARTASLSVAGRDVSVELAYANDTRSRGLMHRTGLEPDAGMLFLFPDSRPRTFWMRNTLIPLDIIFIGDDGIVQNIERGRAGVERPGYHSRGAARFVLEMAGGWSEAAGLEPGHTVEIPESLRALAEE